MLQVVGYRADTCYCIALCHYMMNQYAASLKYITEIIERGIKEHPGEDEIAVRRGCFKELCLFVSRAECGDAD